MIISTFWIFFIHVLVYIHFARQNFFGKMASTKKEEPVTPEAAKPEAATKVHAFANDVVANNQTQFMYVLIFFFYFPFCFALLYSPGC